MGPTLVGLFVGFGLLAAILWPLERLWPGRRGQSLRRPGLGTDLSYWLFTPVVTKGLTRVAVIGAVLLGAALAGVPLDKAHVQAFVAAPGGLVSRQPLLLLVIEVLILGDVIGYGMHRLFHGRALWRFHAVHHSSTHLDWVSAVRVHPVNDILPRVAAVVVLLAFGFPPAVLAGYVPFLSFYAVFLHANLGWTFGPFRYVLASPGFHRWHHTAEEEGQDKNFAGLFPLIDLAFGTFYMPDGRRPERFGLAHETVPSGLLPQLAYPFRKPRPEAVSAV